MYGKDSIVVVVGIQLSWRVSFERGLGEMRFGFHTYGEQKTLGTQFIIRGGKKPWNCISYSPYSWNQHRIYRARELYISMDTGSLPNPLPSFFLVMQNVAQFISQTWSLLKVSCNRNNPRRTAQETALAHLIYYLSGLWQSCRDSDMLLQLQPATLRKFWTHVQ